MQVEFKLNDRVTLHVEGKAITDVVETIAAASEVFDDLTCPVNGSKDTTFVVREVDGNKFYELRDRKSGYKLAYGQHKKGGTLFKKKKDAEGKWLDNNGWTKWEGNKED